MGDTSRHSPYLHRQKKTEACDTVVRSQETFSCKESQPAADEDGEMKAEPPVTQPETEMADVESHHHLCPPSRAANRHVAALRLPSLACARTTRCTQPSTREQSASERVRSCAHRCHCARGIFLPIKKQVVERHPGRRHPIWMAADKASPVTQVMRSMAAK